MSERTDYPDIEHFILDRLLEDEAAALAVLSARPAEGFSAAAFDVAFLGEPLRTFVLNYGPHRAIAEICSKREILNALGCEDWLARSLASPYRGHDDYDPEWSEY